MAPHQTLLYHVKGIVRGRFTYLLTFMFLTLLMFPFIEETPYGPAVMQILYSFMLMSALYAVVESGWVWRGGILLFVAAMVSHWWIILTFSPISVVTGIFSEIIFLCFIAVSLVTHVFGHERVTGNTIAGAICVFLLIGFIWMLACQAIYFFDPGAFSNVATSSFSHSATMDLVYYSFATLTTLGYGDIAPISRPARMFAVTEALVGQIYLTVLVARLVSQYVPVRASRAGLNPSVPDETTQR